MSARNRAGVTGNSRMRTLTGRNASSIAETIAAGAPMAPLSAAPLTPSGFNGLGDSMNFDRRHDIDGRQQIVRESDGKRLSSGIVTHPFQQSRADTVHHGAM